MERVDITVFYLEMLAPSQRVVPAPRVGLAVTHVPEPTVPYDRSLHDAVGKDYHWLSRREMPHENLGAVLRETDVLVEESLLLFDVIQDSFKLHLVRWGPSGVPSPPQYLTPIDQRNRPQILRKTLLGKD